MSMGVILKITRDHLRSTYTWSNDQCRVSPNGEPPDAVGQWFVALDEEAVDAGKPEDFFLDETHRIVVWASRRVGAYPQDRREALLIDEDIHLANIELPHTLERKIVKALHFNFTLMNAVNTELGAPSANDGDIIQTPLFYRGRSKTQIETITDGQREGATWARRALRFGGFQRIQAVDIME